ncbi:MAG: manganese efflux pump MntP family protein [Synergistaceae bacterium]|jgi:putative Mn2+ efflux pump MntP|nr:manganese efflux pump MntP family protein [Synergistaceae bacterium]
MGLTEIILIALGLSMDAFAVSVTLGLSSDAPKLKEFFTPAVFFGAFQALMPALGYAAARYLADGIRGFDHWIAFVLLCFIGGKGIKDSFSTEKEWRKPETNSRGLMKMFVLAVATSIDALAAGITFAFLGADIFRAAALTGAITFAVAACGVKIGNIFGTKFKTGAELAGGTILVSLGVKILLEHTIFS